MARDENVLDYGEFIEKAMKDAIKYALKRAEKAKIGNFCFFITINTKVKGVKIPDYVKKQHPEEMVLVLQYQFDKLKVSNNSFSLEIAFDGKMENIKIPFNAISVFSDNVADTELRFNTNGEESRFDGGYFLRDEIECEFGDEIEDDIDEGEIEGEIEYNLKNKVDFKNNLIMFSDIRRE